MTREELLALGLSPGQADAVHAQISPLQGRIRELEGKIALGEKKNAVLAALGPYNARNDALLMRLIDLDRVEIGKDGEIDGLRGQIDALRAASPYLFRDLPDPDGGNPGAAAAAAAFDMNTFLRGER